MSLIGFALIILAAGLLIPQFVVEWKYLAHARSQFPGLYDEWRQCPVPGERILFPFRKWGVKWKVWWRVRRQYYLLLLGDVRSELEDDYLAKLSRIARILGLAFLLYACFVMPLWMLTI